LDRLGWAWQVRWVNLVYCSGGKHICLKLNDLRVKLKFETGGEEGRWMPKMIDSSIEQGRNINCKETPANQYTLVLTANP